MSAENPYQPTAEVSPPPGAQRFYSFKSTATLTNSLTAMLVLCAILTAGIGALDLVSYAIIPGYASGDFELDGFAQPAMIAMVILGIGSMLVYIVCAITFCVWTYRANANAHSFGNQGMRFTPGWAVAYWFIPIVNLIRPYQTFCETYRASESEQANWQHLRVPAFFAGWWFCWVVGNIVSRIETRAAMRGFDLGPAAIPISVSSTLLTIGAAILAVRVIRRISRVQEARAFQAHTADPARDGWGFKP